MATKATTAAIDARISRTHLLYRQLVHLNIAAGTRISRSPFSFRNGIYHWLVSPVTWTLGTQFRQGSNTVLTEGEAVLFTEARVAALTWCAAVGCFSVYAAVHRVVDRGVRPAPDPQRTENW